MDPRSPLHERRVGPSWQAALVLAAATLGASAAPAHAYRTFAHDTEVLYEARVEGGEIAFSIYAPEGAADSAEIIERAAAVALERWTAPSCVGLSAGVSRSTTPATSGDGAFTIEIVTSGWGDRGLEADRGATTELQLLRDETGHVRIADAEIYLDFEHYDWVDGAAESGALDPTAVLTHEIGHALGLLHPCELLVSGAPECETVDRESAMYPVYLGTPQADPGADDIAGVCALYPAHPCEPACDDGFDCIEGECRACSGDECWMSCPPEGCVLGPCSAEAACDAGTCSVAGEHEGWCLNSGALGTPCSAGGDCRSRLCLDRSAGASYCTTLCADDSDCPGLQRCAPVDGRNACAPLPSGGCSAATGSSRAPAWLLALCLAIAFRARGSRSKNERAGARMRGAAKCGS